MIGPMRRCPDVFRKFVDRSGSQHAAAAALGTSQAMVSQILSGRCQIPAKRALKWAHVMDVPLEKLRPDMAVN